MVERDLAYLNLKCVPGCGYSVDVCVSSITVSRCCIVFVLDLIMHACVQVVQYLTTFTSACTVTNNIILPDILSNTFSLHYVGEKYSQNNTVFTARCYASAVNAVMQCPSVCPSVCLSVWHVRGSRQNE